MNNTVESLKGGLIVSCQAIGDEPLKSPMIMARMAYAAGLGGAAGIRANSYEDIVEIKKSVDIPVIGIVKRDYPDSQVYITPTIREVDELMEAKADIIALDATKRPRPYNSSMERFYDEIRNKYKNVLLMADISTYEEGIQACKIGFDIISTTLSGYTPYSRQSDLPDFELIRELVKNVSVPVIAEGKIWTPEEAFLAVKLGAYAVVVGTAITRPKEITKRFVSAIKGGPVFN